MSVIQQNDLIESVAEAFVRINRVCPPDYEQALRTAATREQNPKRRDAVHGYLTECLSEKKEGELIASEPDMAVVFMRVGQDVHWSGFTGSLQEAVSEGIGRACAEFSLSSPSRDDALPSSRFTAGRSVPVFIHWELVPGEQVQLTVAARSGQDESKTRLLMKDPQESIADSVLAQLNELRESFRFPFVLGVGVGGTAENAVLTARECLNDPLNMAELLDRGPQTSVENLRTEIFRRLNEFSDDAGSFVLRPPVLDVKIRLRSDRYPVWPICLMLETGIPRRMRFVLDGTGPVFFQ